MIVVGTAGHIDHGKSAIVKRLTGTDPDRLPEEKARGMTIDLGFAFYTTAEGRDVALVDVPGHERFVRNMIAGAGGIDAVMLVVAADDGWMPQSEEHFQITRLLGVKHGFVVINKIDLAEPDWLELLEEEIRSKIEGTFLEQASIIKLSAVTGEGFDRLESELSQLAIAIGERNVTGKARLAIDRSFLRPGMGGVVTGTLRGDNLQVGQMVGLWPSQLKAKIRSLQSNGSDAETVTPGQRTALSFTGVDRQALVRGGVVSARTDLNFFVANPILALKAEVLSNALVPIEDRRRLLLIVGTTEVEGEVRIFDRETLEPGGAGVVFFRPDEPVHALVLDHYVFRLPTPMVTIGGGIVLDHLPAFPRRRHLERFDYLNLRAGGAVEALVISELLKKTIDTRENLLSNADLSEADVIETLTELIKHGTLGENGTQVFHADTLQSLVTNLTERMTAHFKDNPHEKGVTAERIAEMLGLERGLADQLLDYMQASSALHRDGELWNIPGRGLALKGIIKEAYEQILTSLRANEFSPPSLSQLAARGKPHQQAIKYLLESEEGYKCGSSFVFLKESWDKMTASIRKTIESNGSLQVGDLRDEFGISRRYAIPILEETDRIGLTERKGDVRVKGRKFEE